MMAHCQACFLLGRKLPAAWWEMLQFYYCTNYQGLGKQHLTVRIDEAIVSLLLGLVQGSRKCHAFSYF